MLEKLFEKQQSPLIEAAFDDVTSMLAQAAKMFDLAIDGLLNNVEIGADLDHMDDFVDRGEQMVRRSVLEHLAFNPTQELVPSLVLVSMVQDAERIGDFARGLESLIPLARSPREGEYADRLRDLVAQLRPLFERCEESFRADDVEGAREVLTEAAEINAVGKRLVIDIAGSQLTADMAVVYSGATQFLRRIGAHLGNIASCVVQPYDRIKHEDE